MSAFREEHVRNEMLPKDQYDRVNEATIQVKMRITVVRTAVAKLESTPVTPILLRTAVASAKRAERATTKRANYSFTRRAFTSTPASFSSALINADAFSFPKPRATAEARFFSTMRSAGIGESRLC